MSKKSNILGSEVVEGFHCKPTIKDPNRPIMFYKAHLLICQEERCAKKCKESFVKDLRDIVSDIGLDKGKNRIKITKTFCFGACRYNSVAVIYGNRSEQNSPVWLKKIDKFTNGQWIEIFSALENNKNLEELVKNHLISMESF